MRNEVVVALAKALKSGVVSKASEELGVGKHQIDATIKITGTITKGADYEQVQHMRVDHWGMIAVLLSKLNGVTIESVVKEVNGVDPDLVTTIKEQAQQAMDKVKAPAVAMTAGKVTTSLVCEEVEDIFIRKLG